MHAHDHSHPTWSAAALDNLQAEGLRNGGARRAVVEHLGAQSCCRSAQEIFDGIRADGGRVGIASVYRALDQLVELRLVQRVELGDGVARFEPSHATASTITTSSATTAARSSRSADPGLEQALERRRGAPRLRDATPTRSCSTAAATTAARPLS